MPNKETLVKEAEIGHFVDNLLRDIPGYAVVGLQGDLGAGKTTLVRSVIAKLGGTERVISPTFVFHQNYPNLKRPIEHFDLYRLESADEKTLIEIGYFEALERAEKSKGIVFVEWPEKVKEQKLLLLTHLIEISIETEHSRRIICRKLR